MGPFTQQIGNEGIVSGCPSTRCNSLSQTSVKQQGNKDHKRTEKTGLYLSEDDESKSSIPCVLALRKYVDKRA